jgi:signal peptidase I
MSNLLRQVGDGIIDLLETFVIAVCVYFVIHLFAFQPHEVLGQSMDGIANFHNGQYILTDKVTYNFRDPKRGEVIVFKYPQDKSKDYIKRLIGLPGEEIMLIDNKIYIFNSENPDGFVLDESEYIGGDVVTTGRTFLEEGQRKKIPEGNYFVMGDNRPQSSDSRTWGFVPEEDIVGRSFFRYWPPHELGLIKSAKFEN